MKHICNVVLIMVMYQVMTNYVVIFQSNEKKKCLLLSAIKPKLVYTYVCCSVKFYFYSSCTIIVKEPNLEDPMTK